MFVEKVMEISPIYTLSTKKFPKKSFPAFFEKTSISFKIGKGGIFSERKPYFHADYLTNTFISVAFYSKIACLLVVKTSNRSVLSNGATSM